MTMNSAEKEGMRRAFSVLTAWISVTSPDSPPTSSQRKGLMSIVEEIGLDIQNSEEGFGEAFLNYTLSLTMLLDAALIGGGRESQEEKLGFIQNAAMLNEVT